MAYRETIEMSECQYELERDVEKKIEKGPHVCVSLIIERQLVRQAIK